MITALFYIILAILLITLLIIYLKLIRPEKRVYDIFRAQGVAGEPFVPLLGQIYTLHRYREADKMMVYYDDLIDKYGHICLYSFGPVLRILINEPDMLGDVLSRANAPYYIKAPLNTTILAPIIGDHNLLVSQGAEHERGRRMINPAFHHTSLKSMIFIIADQTGRTIDRILSETATDKGTDLQILFNMLTLSVIISSAFGSDMETNVKTKNVMSRMLSETLDAILYRSLRMINQIDFLSKLPICKKDIVERGARTVAEFVDQIIVDRRQGRSSSLSNGPDLLDLLLSAADDDGQTFTDQEVKEHALAFVVAGSETTGNLMVWVLYILMTHESVLQACREEVDRVLPKDGEITSEHLADLPICEAIINETLRLYPTAPAFVRQCIHEHTIGTQRSLRIPVGAAVLINSYTLHRRSDLWPRPLEFDYTRWLRDTKTGLKPKLPHPFAYLPFAAGPRNCIGQNFALLEAKILLAMFVQRCHFQMVPGQKIVPDLKITMRPKYGLFANISKRAV